MSSQAANVTRILKRLQGLIRQPPSGDRTVRSGRVPADIATENFQMLCLQPDEEDAYQEALAILLADPRFEHFEKPRAAAEALWRFLCSCHADRSHDQVAQFITEHAREPLEATCYLPIEHFTVETATEATGLRLLPTCDEAVPPPRPRFVLDPPVGCVAAVAVTGTSYARMADRARARTEQGLRLLRIALQDRVHARQLRFTLSGAYAFDDRTYGWDERPEAAYSLTLGPARVDHVRSQPVAALPLAPRNKLERKADLAARWMERASLATEPLIRLLLPLLRLGSPSRRHQRRPESRPHRPPACHAR